MSYDKGVNFFSYDDRALLLALIRGEHVITGFRHLDVQRQLPRLSSSQISRHVKRLRVHGVIKRIAHRYKYYVTALGRGAIHHWPQTARALLAASARVKHSLTSF